MTGAAPSFTAQRVAMHRAAHQLLDNPQVFQDPLAVAILGEEVARLKSQLDRFDTAGARQIRAFVIAKSRYAEDELNVAIARGATQYVILGAGLDTYAYRSTQSRLRVFEVDYPASQVWKRTQLETAGIGFHLPWPSCQLTSRNKRSAQPSKHRAFSGTRSASFRGLASHPI